MKQLFPLGALLMLALFVASCDRTTDDGDQGNYSNGTFITNEGPYNNGAGTITFFNDKTNTTSQDVFGVVNEGASMGNVLQSMAIVGETAYFVINNEGQVLLADSRTLMVKSSIENLELPRYILPINENKMYISQWGANGLTGSVQIFDPTQSAVVGSFTTANGPEQMLLHQGSVYVPMSGGFGNAYKISLINPVTDLEQGVINLGRANPLSLIVDKNNDLWTVCRGHNNFGTPAASEYGALYHIKANAVVDSIVLTSNNCTNLTYNTAANELYVLDGGAFRAFKLDGTETTANYASELTGGNFYSMRYNNALNQLWVGNAGDFASNGQALVFQYNSGSTTLLRNVPTGIIPNSFTFLPQ